MAVVAGLAKEAYYPAIQEVLKQEYNASPYMEKYVMESLFIMGAAEQGVERMLKRFASMIDDSISTLYENFGGGQDRAGSGTNNHAWSGGGLTMMQQYIAVCSPPARPSNPTRLFRKWGRSKRCAPKFQRPSAPSVWT